MSGQKTEFWINGIVLSLAIFSGLAGNIGCFLFLHKRKGSVSFHQTFINLLKWLCFVDSMFLISSFFTFSLGDLSQMYRLWIYPYAIPVLLPVTSILLNISMYCVACLTIERYLTICRPNHMNKGSFQGYVLPIVVFSIIFNLPKFFELKTIYVNDGTGYSSEEIPFSIPTKLRKSSEYSYYTIGAGFLLLGLLPFVTVLIMNILVLREKNKIQTPSSISITSSERISKFREASLNPLLLIGGIILMGLCHLPRHFFSMYELYLVAMSMELAFVYPLLVDVSHLSLVLCSCFNIFIFILQEESFRKLFDCCNCNCMENPYTQAATESTARNSTSGEPLYRVNSTSGEPLYRVNLPPFERESETKTELSTSLLNKLESV